MTLRVKDNDFYFDLRGRIFDVRAENGTLELKEAIPSDGNEAVSVTLQLDPEMLRALFRRVQANDEKTNSPELQEIKEMVSAYMARMTQFKSFMPPSLIGAYDKIETWANS